AWKVEPGSTKITQVGDIKNYNTKGTGFEITKSISAHDAYFHPYPAWTDSWGEITVTGTAYYFDCLTEGDLRTKYGFSMQANTFAKGRLLSLGLISEKGKKLKEQLFADFKEKRSEGVPHNLKSSWDTRKTGDATSVETTPQ